MVVWVKSLVPKLKNSVSLATSPAVSAARGISIRVPDHVLEVLHAGLAEDFFGHGDHGLLLILEFLGAAAQRDHAFGDHLDALLEDLHDRFEDGARLHFGDLGIDDAETAAAVAQHGVEFV